MMQFGGTHPIDFPEINLAQIAALTEVNDDAHEDAIFVGIFCLFNSFPKVAF